MKVGCAGRCSGVIAAGFLAVTGTAFGTIGPGLEARRPCPEGHGGKELRSVGLQTPPDDDLMLLRRGFEAEPGGLLTLDQVARRSKGAT
jgi:hypothetical protein